jgi:hypothetical protein
MTIARCRESEIAAENKVKQEINQLIKHQTTFPFSFWPFISRTEVPNLLDPPSSLISHFVPPPHMGPHWYKCTQDIITLIPGDVPPCREPLQ